MQFSSSPRTGDAQGSLASAVGPSFLPVGVVASRIAADLREVATARRTLTEDAWVAFLSCHEWQWFGTFTYKDPIHPEAADKQFRFWTRVNDDRFGVSKRAPAVAADRLMWIRGLEWQKRGVLHYHALLRNVPPHLHCRAERRAAAHLWLEISGGFARIDPVHSSDAISYVAKYSAKGGEVDFSRNFELPDGTRSRAPLLAVQASG